MIAFQPLLPLDRHLESLRDDRERLAEVSLERLDAAIPGCPDWDLGALLAHLGLVHRFALRMMATAPDESVGRGGERPPEGRAVRDWLIDGLDRLIDEFEGGGWDRPCASFVGPATVGWWLRRQALETAVHRWDAESAAGTPEAIPADLAADGVEEWLDLVPQRWTEPPEGLRGTLHLHATDGEGEWLVTIDDDHLRWERGHHKGDVAVRAPLDDLYLLLWNRIPASRVEVIGDRPLLDRFLAELG